GSHARVEAGGAGASRRRRARPRARGRVSESTLQRRRDDLLLQLKGLVHVRALLELRGATAAELDAHAREADRVRAELARLPRAPKGLRHRAAGRRTGRAELATR